MTITCPQCGTRYRVPGGKRLVGTPYRCTRCRHVFEADEPGEEAPAEPAALVVEDDGDEFTFEDDTDEPASAPPDDAPAPPPPSPPRGAHRGPLPSPAVAPMTGAPVGRFAVRAVAAVTLGYAVLSIYLYTHPAVIRETLGRLPLIGAGLAETRLDPATVQLTDVTGRYTRVQGDHLVFVITGTAINNSPAVVRGIQLQGKIRGSRDDRQTIFCSPPPRAVEELSLQEIALLQTLEAPREWVLPSGGQSPFTIVFPQPAQDVRELTVEVVAVQAAHRRGGSGPGTARPAERTAAR